MNRRHWRCMTLQCNHQVQRVMLGIFLHSISVTMPFITSAMSVPQAPSSPSTGPVPVDGPVRAPGPDMSASTEQIGVQGNWLKKREWFLKASDVEVTIQGVASQVEPVRQRFLDSYQNIQDALHAYYTQLGIERGSADELFTNVEHYLEKKHKEALAGLSQTKSQSAEFAIQEQIDLLQENDKRTKEQLDQLRLDMKSIDDLNRSLTDRLNRLDQQNELIESQASRAYTILQQMEDIIDHNKARESYYTLNNTILPTVQASLSYLQNDLSNDFNNVIGTIQNQITQTNTQIKVVEDRGIIVKDRMRRVKELKDEAEKRAQLELELSKKMPQAPTQPVRNVKAPEHWYMQFYNGLKELFMSIYSWFTPTNNQAKDTIRRAQELKEEAATRTQLEAELGKKKVVPTA